MTEQELTQARADLAQLDIEQLRCGVMLQLLTIEALTKERDAAMEQNTLLDAACAKLEGERDEYAKAADDMAAAHKLERDALIQMADKVQTQAIQIDTLQYEVDAIPAIKAERDALMSAAKLAWVAIVELRYSSSTDKSRSVSEFAVQALREAGVQ